MGVPFLEVILFTRDVELLLSFVDFGSEFFAAMEKSTFEEPI